MRRRAAAVRATCVVCAVVAVASAVGSGGFREGVARGAPADEAPSLDDLLQRLAAAPDDVGLLAAAADAAAGEDRKDDALWLLHRAISTAESANRADPRIAGLAEKRDALDPVPPEQRAFVDEYADTLREIGRIAGERRHYVNAVQVLARLTGSREARRAEALLDGVYGDQKAVGALLDSAIPVPATTTFERIRRKSARDEAKHTDWKSAWKQKTRNYTVLCNDGWEIASRVSTAMERINQHYRNVFDVGSNRLGFKTKMCEVRLHASRAEYLKVGNPPEGALAYYSPSEIAVVAYDPRSDGSPLSSLWGTLFHEASHQFTDLISPGLVPAWLNEGTASYFEGASIRADGGIETNLVPMGRLTNLVDTLQTHTPTLRDVVSFHQPGSYPAEYYCVGWGLVYFMRNYENEAGDLVYLPHYQAFMDSYRQDTAEPAAYERFVQHFVTDPEEEGIETFEDFERRLSDWIGDLNDLHAGPPDRAGAFVKQGMRQLGQGHPDRAEESFRNGLRKSSDHVGALLALADLATAAGRDDEAIARLREVLEQVGRYGDAATGFEMVPFDSSEALAAEASKRIAAIDPVFAKVLARVDREFPKKVLACAETYRAAGFPRNAVRVLEAASTLLDGYPEIDREAQRISDEAGLRVLLWRTLPAPDDLDGWWHSPEWKATKGVVSGAAVGAARAALYDATIPSHYRFEATVTPQGGGENSFYGLLFGVDPDGAWDSAGVAGDWLEIDRIFDGWDRLASPSGLTQDQLRECRIAVEVRPGRARFFVDGEFAGEQEYPPGELRGGIGLLVNDAAVRFSRLRTSW